MCDPSAEIEPLGLVPSHPSLRPADVFTSAAVHSRLAALMWGLPVPMRPVQVMIAPTRWFWTSAGHTCLTLIRSSGQVYITCPWSGVHMGGPTQTPVRCWSPWRERSRAVVAWGISGAWLANGRPGSPRRCGAGGLTRSWFVGPLLLWAGRLVWWVLRKVGPGRSWEMPEESKNKMMLKQKGGGGHCRISFNIFEYIMTCCDS